MRARGLWITATLIAMALPAYADKSPGKGASKSAAASKSKKPGGKATAPDERPAKGHGKPEAAGASKKPGEGAPGAGKGEHAKGARKNPGRPESSEDVPGKAKGLDKERPSDEEEKAEAEDSSDSPDAKRQRRERKEQRVEKLKKKWGRALSHPSVVASLKVHERRMARLERIRELAEKAEKDDVVERVDGLIDKENERHERHMEVLASRDSKGGRGKALGKERADKNPGRANQKGKGNPVSKEARK